MWCVRRSIPRSTTLPVKRLMPWNSWATQGSASMSAASCRELQQVCYPLIALLGCSMWPVERYWLAASTLVHYILQCSEIVYKTGASWLGSRAPRVHVKSTPMYRNLSYPLLRPKDNGQVRCCIEATPRSYAAWISNCETSVVPVLAVEFLSEMHLKAAFDWFTAPPWRVWRPYACILPQRIHLNVSTIYWQYTVQACIAADVAFTTVQTYQSSIWQ